METINEQEITKMVGARLREWRKANNISQEKLGDALGVTFQQVQKYESGKNRISVTKLIVLSRRFNAGLKQFFVGEVETNAPAPYNAGGHYEI